MARSSPAMDLFAFAEARPAPPPPAVASALPPTLPVPSLPQGTVAWQRLLDRLQHPRLIMMPSVLWTGEALEVASDPVMGRAMLMRDGTIRPLPPDSAYGRIAYLTVARAQELHRAHGLVLIGKAGSVSAQFRFATGADPSTAHTAAVLAALAAATRSAFQAKEAAHG